MDLIKFAPDGTALFEGVITVYNWSAGNGVFSHASSEQVVYGVGLPANCTHIAPPNAGTQGFSWGWDGNQWVVIPDHTGELCWNKITGECSRITSAGDIPSAFTLDEPYGMFDFWDGFKWVTNKTAELEYFAKLNSENRRKLLQGIDEELKPLIYAKEGGFADDEDLNKIKLLKLLAYKTAKTNTNVPFVAVFPSMEKL